eukprot:13714587-Alexandrium_andersonii.AAC.1
MSASLVGSEMCIRDRSRPALGENKASGYCDQSVEGPSSRLGQHATAGIPVSYTHLTLPTICSV